MNLQDDERLGKILFNKPAGTASGSNSFTARATLPTSWIRDMGLTREDRSVVLRYNYDSKSITIVKNPDEEPTSYADK